MLHAAMALDLPRIRALCFDIDGTLADTDDHLVARLATLIDAVPAVSGRRAEKLARQTVMALESPVHAAYARLDAWGLDVPLQRLRDRLRAIRQRGADPAHTRNPEALDEVPHDMVPGVQDMLHALARRWPMCTISTGHVPRIDRFLRHYGVRELFTAVIGAETTARMKPHPEPLLHAAAAMGVAPEACLMIGDTTVDMRTGVAAGAQCVGVLCGFGTEDELWRTGAQLVLRTTSDLLPVLLPEQDPLHSGSASPEPAARGGA
jgi:HAD superfamily hydrolase (TIGR01509 family)